MSIVDDCTLLLEDFSFNGAAPAVHIWGAPSLDNRDIREQGRRISPLHLDRAYANETVRNAEMPVPAEMCELAHCTACMAYQEVGASLRQQCTYSAACPSHSPLRAAGPSLARPTPACLHRLPAVHSESGAGPLLGHVPLPDCVVRVDQR